LKGNQKAKATVSAIIDGTGSIGAAIGPFLIGWVVENVSVCICVLVFLLFHAVSMGGCLLYINGILFSIFTVSLSVGVH
jgi:OPA family glycerol-3-phosphate transporter-like MFS transporter 1/2